MARIGLEAVRVLLAEPKPALREELRNQLRLFGFEQIYATGNMLAVEDDVTAGRVDLLIGDATLPEGDLANLVYRIRHNEIGPDPFLVAIVMVSDPSPELVRKVIDSGADDVLLKPFEGKCLVDRIDALTRGRKRFVVTTDYIGPDRRKTSRGGGIEIPQVSVPNTLRVRATGQMDDARLERAIASTLATINTQKVERHAYQVRYLAERIVPACEQGLIDGEIKGYLAKLHKVALDMSNRVSTTPHAHVAGMCMTLLDLTRRVVRRVDAPDATDVRLLGKLAGVLDRAVAGGAEDEEEGDTLASLPEEIQDLLAGV